MRHFTRNTHIGTVEMLTDAYGAIATSRRHEGER